MIRRAAVLVFCCALLACREERPATPAAPVAQQTATQPALDPNALTTPLPDNDVDNSLNMLYGAAVVSRDGELNLETSAVHTIDAFGETAWTSVPGVPEETIVYSLLAPARLSRVGVSTNGKAESVMERVEFDASMDGKKWTKLATVKPTLTLERQFVDVKPTVVQYLRVRTIDPANHAHVRLRAVHALGEEVAPPVTPPFAGCWEINGERAHLEQNGARITGRIESDPPTYIDGGTDNRVGMIIWMRGPTWGLAALTRSPDGKHLSGLTFFNDAVWNIGEGWFGDRCEGGTAIPVTPQMFLSQAKTYPLYGLVFDPNDRLVEELSAPTLEAVVAALQSSPQRFRIVARELRYDTLEQNRQHNDARLQAIRAALQKRGVNLARIEFVNAGNDVGGFTVRSSLQRALLSRVDLVSGT